LLNQTDSNSAGKYLLNLIMTLRALGRIAEANHYCDTFFASQVISSEDSAKNHALIEQERAHLQALMQAGMTRKAGNHTGAISLYEQALTRTADSVAMRLLHGDCLTQVAVNANDIISNYTATLRQLAGDSLKVPFPANVDVYENAVRAYQDNMVDINNNIPQASVQFFEVFYQPYLAALIIQFSLQSDCSNLQIIINSIRVVREYFNQDKLLLKDNIKSGLNGILATTLSYLEIFKLLIVGKHAEVANAFTNIFFHQPNAIPVKMAQAIILAMQQAPIGEQKIAEVRALIAAQQETASDKITPELAARFESALVPEATRITQVEMVKELLDCGLRQRLISPSQQRAIAQLQEIVMAVSKQSAKKMTAE